MSGALLRARRLVQGLTLSALSHLTGLGLVTISDLERGRRTPTEAEQALLDKHLTAPAPKCLACLDKRVEWHWAPAPRFSYRVPCQVCCHD